MKLCESANTKRMSRAPVLFELTRDTALTQCKGNPLNSLCVGAVDGEPLSTSIQKEEFFADCQTPCAKQIQTEMLLCWANAERHLLVDKSTQ